MATRCADGKPKTSKTGAKETNPAKKSTRAKSFKGTRHPRKKKGGKGGGQFDKTSAASKKKYGKGGTTKASAEAACKKRRR